MGGTDVVVMTSMKRTHSTVPRLCRTLEVGLGSRAHRNSSETKPNRDDEGEARTVGTRRGEDDNNNCDKDNRDNDIEKPKLNWRN